MASHVRQRLHLRSENIHDIYLTVAYCQIACDLDLPTAYFFPTYFYLVFPVEHLKSKYKQTRIETACGGG